MSALYWYVPTKKGQKEWAVGFSGQPAIRYFSQEVDAIAFVHYLNGGSLEPSLAWAHIRNSNSE